jgi:hypothetical protein
MYFTVMYLLFIIRVQKQEELNSFIYFFLLHHSIN